MRGFAAVGLWRPKNALNIGGALRAAHCYRAAFVAAEWRDGVHAASDTQRAWKHMPLFKVEDLFSVVPYETRCVAVDLLPEAMELSSFVHPERALYIFGPENGTLPEEVAGRCAAAVKVATRHCMNLAAAVNVVLYDRLAKQQRAAEVLDE